MLSDLITFSLLIVVYPLVLYLFYQYKSVLKDLKNFKKETEQKFEKIKATINKNNHIIEDDS